MQMTTKAARFGARLEAIGRRYHELERRIDAARGRPIPDELILKRLDRERQRLKAEMQCYEGLLRTVAGNLPQAQKTGTTGRH